MADSCIFCKITAGEIPTDVVYEDDHVMAFRDASPQAPVHVLLVPKVHIADALEMAAYPEADRLLGQLARAAATVAESEAVDQSGFRLLVNCGEDAGQTVRHYHVHLLGGVKMGEGLL